MKKTNTKKTNTEAGLSISKSGGGKSTGSSCKEGGEGNMAVATTMKLN